jgi:hypothetical protein
LQEVQLLLTALWNSDDPETPAGLEEDVDKTAKDIETLEES